MYGIPKSNLSDYRANGGYVNIPEAINEMAAQNLVLNQDRLTKNYYVYHDPETSEWAKLPWDLEAAFGLSPGYLLGVYIQMITGCGPQISFKFCKNKSCLRLVNSD